MPAQAAPAPTREASAFAALGSHLYAAVFVASLVSNIGTFMQGVGSQWLMTDLTSSPVVVSSLQAAAALPVLLLALPAGALADVVDRRKLLLVAQTWMLLTSAALAAATFAGVMTPTLLIAFTLLMGVGAALNMPAWFALVPDLVSRSLLPSAVLLNGIAFTLAQAIGPAIGGLVVAASGPTAVFALNAASYIGTIVVFGLWRRRTEPSRLPAEHVLGAIRAGARYVRFARPLQVVLIRAAAYMIAISSVFALLPLIARGPLGTGAAGFGLLLTAMGAGAVLGALWVPRLRSRLGFDGLIIAASVIAAIALLLLGQTTSKWWALPIMALLGLGQMAAMSTFNLSAQMVLPGWVRARGLALYTVTFQSAIAVGAIAWGALAQAAGLGTALATAAGVALAGIVLARPLPLGRATEVDLTPHSWPDAPVVFEPDPRDGPILVMQEYLIDPQHASEFATAAQRLRRLRRRDGAMRWGLYSDLVVPGRQIETYVVPSWGEHLRQRSRTSLGEREVWLAVRGFDVREEGPQVRHFLRLRPGAEGWSEGQPGVQAVPLLDPLKAG